MALPRHCVTFALLTTVFLLLTLTEQSYAEEEETVYFTIRGLDAHSRVRRGLLDKVFGSGGKTNNGDKNTDFKDNTQAKTLEMAVKKLDGSTVKMTMGKMKKFAPSIKMLKMSGGKLVEDVTSASNVEYSLFKDVSNGTDSVFLMACVDGICSVSAAIYDGTEVYTLEPANAEPFMNKGKSQAQKAKKTLNDMRTMGVASDGSDLGVPFTVRKRRDLVLDRKMTESLLKRKRRQLASVNNVVELVIIADYSEYQYWYQRAGNDSMSAKTIMALYFVLMTNMMDMRFENLFEQTSDMDIKFMVNAIIYAESEADSPWLSDNTVNNNGATLVNVNKALDDLTVWSWGNRADFPSHDHVMAVSKTDMATLVDGAWSPDVIGIAWTGGMCSAGYSVSIVEDPGVGLIDYAAAHEIGHNLGATHDGTAGCSDDDYFIMGEYGGAPAVGLLATGREDHSFRFSTCSVNAIHDFVTGLSSNCMQSSTYDPATYDSYKTFSSPGVFLPMDTQCELQYGKGSRRCYALDASICSDGAWCWNPADPGYCYTMYVREGSLCGDHMRCHKGACVDSNIVMPTCPPVTGVTSGQQVVVVPVGVTAVPEEMVTTVTPYQSTSQAVLASQQTVTPSGDNLFC